MHGFLIIPSSKDEDAQTKEGHGQEITLSVKIFRNKGQGPASNSASFFSLLCHKNCDSTAQIKSSVVLWASKRPAMAWHTGLPAKQQVSNEKSLDYKRILFFKILHKAAWNFGRQNHVFHRLTLDSVVYWQSNSEHYVTISADAHSSKYTSHTSKSTS